VGRKSRLELSNRHLGVTAGGRQFHCVLTDLLEFCGDDFIMLREDRVQRGTNLFNSSMQALKCSGTNLGGRGSVMLPDLYCD